MTDPIAAREDLADVVDLVAAAAKDYLAGLDAMPVVGPGAAEARERMPSAFPDKGEGTLAPLRALLADGLQAATNSAGPRFFHFVIGGVTPAALGADWITSLIDQNGALWPSSPLSARLEQTAIRWLLDLFDLPSSWGGTLTPSATYANFAGLAAARSWWGERIGVDIGANGLSGLPQVPVLSSGYIHMSARKALSMLGMGREQVRTFARDASGALDLDAMRAALQGLGGLPAIIVGNAGEVNAGDFDPLDAMADLAEKFGAWLHVDGAFGLFARATPEAADLARGLERANSVIGDGHKWLNVPYDCGFVFTRDPAALAKPFAASNAAYLPSPEDPNPNYLFLGPDSSRRARSLAVWATLLAYGRDGHRAMIERHLGLAKHLARRIEAEPDLQLMAPAQLNIVCFRIRPAGASDEECDALNARVGAAVLEDGRVFVGTSTYAGRTVFRPAIVNWRTTEADVDALVDVVLELARA